MRILSIVRFRGRRSFTGAAVPLLIVACGLVLSCAKTPVLLEADIERSIEVFSVMDGVSATKGAGEITTASLRSRSFGLFAWWTSSSTYFSGISVGSLYLDNMEMDFVESTISGDRWTCSTPTFWPIGCNLTFFAYAPYLDCDGAMLSLPNGESSLLPRGTFTQDTDVREQVDLCLAAPVYDRSSSAGDVPMAFTHALSKVLFYVNIEGTPDEEEDFVYRVESLSVNDVVGSNTFTYGNSNVGYRWDDIPRSDLASRDTDYFLTRANGELVDDILIHVDDLTSETSLDRYVCVNGTSDGYLYLLPQPMTGASTVEMVIYGYSVEGGNLVHKTTLDPFVLRLPEETVWSQGSVVAYAATLDITRWDAIINFTATVTPWGAETIVPTVWDNAVYLTRSEDTFSIASVGTEWSCGDLLNNPPYLYINGVQTAVSQWTRVSETSLTAEVATGVFTFTLSSYIPVSVTFLAN